MSLTQVPLPYPLTGLAGRYLGSLRIQCTENGQRAGWSGAASHTSHVPYTYIAYIVFLKPEPEMQVAHRFHRSGCILCGGTLGSDGVSGVYPGDWDVCLCQTRNSSLADGAQCESSPTKGVPAPRVVCSVLSRLPRGIQGSSANYPCQVLLGTDPLCSCPQGTCPGGPEPSPSCGPSRAGQALGSFGGRESMSDSESKPWAQVPAQHLSSCGNQDCGFVALSLSVST